MATVAQIAANRLNAQKSTGPRSVDGKLASSMNALLLAEGLTPEAVDVTVLRDSATGKLLLRVWRQMASLERAHKSARAEIRRLCRERARREAEEIQLRLDAPLPAPHGP